MDETPKSVQDPWTQNPEQPEIPPAQASAQIEQHLINAVLGEQRRARRWNIFFKGAFLLYLIVLLVMVWNQDDGDSFSGESGEYVAVVSLEGVIAPDSDASAERVIEGLQAAFKDHQAQGVILKINSPGGSPVQAGMIHDEMQRLRKAHPDRPLYAVVTDVCASGGYYAAVGAERIFADKASMVGSIGVLFNGFGFVDAMERIGVERRLLTAGEHKGFMDPFSQVKPQDQTHIESILGRIHEQFKAVVREGRGDRLKEDPKIFSGLVWTGDQAVEKGLIDGLASVAQVAREQMGVKRVKDVTPKERWLDRLGRSIGASMGNQLLQSITWGGIR